MMSVTKVGRAYERPAQLLTISAHASVAEGARKMLDNEVGSLVVKDDGGRAVGILTERDVMNEVVAKSRNPATTTVLQVMTRELISCAQGTPIAKAQRIMAEHGIRHLPVVRDGVPVGMISSRDVMAHQLSAARSLARRQTKILQSLETEHPGITKLEKDKAGRIVF